jgi:type II secretory pathway pseudopilin PulG
MRELATRWGSERSVTLVECMVALVLLTMGMLAAYMSYAQSTRLINSMWHTSRVNSAIRQQVELVRTWDWDTVDNLATTNFTNDVLEDVPGAVGTVSAEYYPDSTNNTLTIKKVTVEVIWTDLNNVERADTATTLVCSDGLNTATE